MTDVAPTFHDVPPRPPAAAERALAGALVARCPDPELAALLAPQLAAATVTGVCSCGCLSVRLATTAPPVPPVHVERRSAFGRDDWLTVAAMAGRHTVTLHLVGGVVAELEIYAGDGDRSAPPDASTLDDPEIA